MNSLDAAVHCPITSGVTAPISSHWTAILARRREPAALIVGSAAIIAGANAGFAQCLGAAPEMLLDRPLAALATAAHQPALSVRPRTL
jgi:hypothetical protein